MIKCTESNYLTRLGSDAILFHTYISLQLLQQAYRGC